MSLETKQEEKFEKNLTAIRMPLKRKEVFRVVSRLRPDEDLTDAARKLGMSVAAVRQTLYRGREQYRLQKQYTNFWENLYRTAANKRYFVV